MQVKNAIHKTSYYLNSHKKVILFVKNKILI